MRVFIPVHSIVDVITNSSSVIYTEASYNAIELAKKIINSVLALGGSNKTADDLFNFKIVALPNTLYQSILYKVKADKSLEDKIPDLLGLYDADNTRTPDGKLDYTARRIALEEWERNNMEALLPLFAFNEVDRDMGIVNTLIVTTKDGVDTEFAKTALAMFDQEAGYDG